MSEFKPKFVSKAERHKPKEPKQPPVKKPTQRSRSPRPLQPEYQELKNKLLGLKRKPTETFKKQYRFDWDQEEDTSQDPFFANRLSPPRSFQKDIGTSNSDLSSKPLESMTQRDWKIFRENNQIFVKGTIPPPIRNWKELSIATQLKENISKAGYARPMPIQMQAIPVGLQMKDLIGLAPTGTGKSAAYLIPMLEFMLELPELNQVTSADGPYALILAPTRELAQQIFEEASKLIRNTQVKCLLIVGGHNMETQSMELQSGAELVIATPGRLLDCIAHQYLVLNQCYWLVIDEADKMILLELQNTLQEIFNYLPVSSIKGGSKEEVEAQELQTKLGTKRYLTTHLFSATMDQSIEKLWLSFLRFPCFVSIGDPGSGSSLITQQVFFVSESAKKETLLKLLKTTKPQVIVFVNHKKEADNLASYLHRYKATSLHGGKPQHLREQIMQNFKHGKVNVLVATDVASRGIDVKGVNHVINYDCPKSITDYEHRIGRTGRAGASGVASTLLTKEDEDILYPLKTFLEKNSQSVPKELANHPKVKHPDNQILF